MLVWIDLETTGLNCAKDKILEIACIITDDKLNEVAQWECVTGEARNMLLSDVYRRVLEMHVHNGLWNASLLSGVGTAWADLQLSEFIIQHAVTSRQLPVPRGTQTHEAVYPQLAGSTVSFDRNFMEKYLPKSFNQLHYRNLDVSSINVMAKNFWPKVFEGRPRAGADAAHRAMPDIAESLNVARYYAGALGPIV